MSSEHERLTTIEKKFSPAHEVKRPESKEAYRPNPEAEKNELDLARKAALKEADDRHEDEASRSTAETKDTSPRPSKIALKSSFGATMKTVEDHLTTPQRIFSKVIHNPVIERVSDVASTTIARPNAILSGSIGALLLTGTLYLMARYYGFSLSGSETILTFLAGWLLGLVFDIIKGAFRKRG